MTKENPASAIVHASAVVLDGQGVLIRGRSGAGKSRLALELIALGATLVADDRTCLIGRGGRLLLAPPPSLAGLVEARGVGILRLPHAENVPLALLVDLDRPAAARFPEHETTLLLGREIVTIRGADHPFLAAALCCYLTGERIAPPFGG